MMAKNLYFYCCVVFGSIGLIAADTFIPSMSSIAAFFKTDVSLIQKSIAVFMFGFSFARFFIAIISDGFGRKSMFVLCFIFLSIGSGICLISDSVYVFIAGRFFQGVGAGGSNVLARIVIRDITDNSNLAKLNSLYSMYAVTLMVMAPFVGSILQTYSGWQAAFILISVLSLFALLVCIFLYDETNSHMSMHHLNIFNLKKNFVDLFGGELSLKYASLLFVSFGFMTSWLTFGSVILQDKLNLSYMEFGLCALIVGFFYFMSSYLSSRLVMKYGEINLIYIGVRLFSLPPILLSVTFFVSNATITVLILVMSIAIGFSATGLIIPNAYSLGVKASAKIAGMAGAFFGFAQMFGGCIYSYFISLATTTSVLPLIVSMIVTFVISAYSVSAFRDRDKHRLQKKIMKSMT